MSHTSASTIAAIDVHAHYGDYAMFAGEGHPLRESFMTGDAATVARRARQANTQWTVVSPLLGLMPRGQADAVAGNIEASQSVQATPGLLQWVIIDPNRPATYDQARQMLTQPRCVGIKIHPEEHVYPIRRHGDALFSFAAEHRAVVLSHSSERNSIAADLAFFADRYPEMTLILAHIGCGFDGDPTHQVRAAAGCRHGNVYADTSSAQSIMPGLIELAAREMGAERILYGTDTPLYFAPMQRARIDHADLPDEQKRMILRDNAVRLLALEERRLVSAADAVAMAEPG